MDRLIATNSVNLAGAATRPLSGTPQYATDGNPGTSTPATVWPSYQYNAIQEELVGAMLAAGLSLDRNNNAQLTAAIPLLAPGRRIGTRVFSTAGTSSYVPTASMKWIYFRMVGGGGGGGGAALTAAGQDAAGGGGSSGSYCEGVLTAAQIGASQTITIGAAGTAGVAGANNGGNGGASSIGALASAPGGLGGLVRQQSRMDSWSASQRRAPSRSAEPC